MKKFLIFMSITHFSLIFFAQNEILTDKIFYDNIKTVQIKPVGTYFSYPVIHLNSDEKLQFSFDDLDLSNKVYDYQYTIVHCNSDWTPSSLAFSEYIDGFEENYIDDYENSFNTLVDYVHYSDEFPSDNISFLVSGNYALIVYRDNNPEDTVFVKRFYVTENSAVINGQIKRPDIVSKRMCCQQVNFSVESQEFTTADILHRLKVSILQNNRPDVAKYDLKPQYNKGNVFYYENPFENIFPGGNEFHYFSCKNKRFASERIAKIEAGDVYDFFLVPEKPGNKHYFFRKDINGGFYINNELGTQASNDADYVNVHFYLQMDYELPDNDVYIVGEFTQWKKLPAFKMSYNDKYNAYVATVLLKQGYYNYSYETAKDDFYSIDGNFYETRNDYVIYVYLHDQMKNYDRLIAVKVISNQ